MMPATTEILADQPHHPALTAPPLAAGPGAAAVCPLDDPVPARPHVWVLVGSFQTPDGWGLDYYREILSPLLPAIVRQLAAHRRYRQSGGACHRHARVRTAPQRRAGQTGAAGLVTMTGNFSGVPLAFAFIIILGINGAVTLLLKSWGLIDGFNLYSGSGLILIYTYFQILLALLLLYPAFDALQDEWPQAAARSARARGSMCGTWRCRC